MDFILELLQNLAIGAVMGAVVAIIIKTKLYIKEKRKEELIKKEK